MLTYKCEIMVQKGGRGDNEDHSASFYFCSKGKNNVNINKHISNDNNLTESIQIEMLYHHCMICN